MFLDILVKFFFTIILVSSFEENTVGNRVFDTLPKSTYLFLHQFNKENIQNAFKMLSWKMSETYTAI